MQLNETYTISYSQPEEYRFSLDSVFLAQKIHAWILENKLNPKHIADLCAGCGVIGLELLFHIQQARGVAPEHIDFIEVQDQYIPHFEKNKQAMLKLLGLGTSLNFHLQNYQSQLFDQKKSELYDLIVCNPPYFHLGHGKLSPSSFKNRCRYFIDSDFLSLLKWIKQSLLETGTAFLLIRDVHLKKLSINLETEVEKLNLNFIVHGEIRGTQVYKISKPQA